MRETAMFACLCARKSTAPGPEPAAVFELDAGDALAHPFAMLYGQGEPCAEVRFGRPLPCRANAWVRWLRWVVRTRVHK